MPLVHTLRTAALLGLACSILAGCMTSAHLLAYATSKPGEKDCTLAVSVEGFPPAKELATLHVTSSSFPGQRLSINALRPQTSRWWASDQVRQNRPCNAPATLTVGVQLDNQPAHTAHVNLAKAATSPEYARFNVVLRDKLLTVHAYHYTGKTKYSAGAMGVYWELGQPEELGRYDLSEPHAAPMK